VNNKNKLRDLLKVYKTDANDCK